MELSSLSHLRQLARRRSVENLPIFLAALCHKDGEVRAFACHAIGWLREKKYATHLITKMNDSDEGVRYAAAVNLALCGDSTIGTTLLSAIQQDESARVRARAARVVGFLKIPLGAALVRQLETEPNLEVKAQLVYALGQLGYSKATVPLRTLLDDAKSTLRIECIRALSRLQPRIAATDSDLTHEDPLVRIEAIRSLSTSEPTRFAELAPTLFTDENPAVRCAVVIGLRQNNSPTAVACLKTLPVDPHAEVRRHQQSDV